MSAETSTELSRRLAALSPERRAVLQRRLLRTDVAGTASVSDEIPVQPRGQQRDFPLSSAQERMWFNHQWDPERPIYTESFGLSLRGRLDTSVLQQSFEQVMRRHEIFTVTFHSTQGRLFQRLGGCAIPAMEVSDLRSHANTERESLYEIESRRILREPFRLDEGPLFRARVWIVSDESYRLIFAMHHIIFDGWSAGIIFRELFTAYVALVAGREPAWAPPGPQYVDFAVWEQTHFERTSASLELQIEYWKKQLQGAPGAPELAVDHHFSRSEAHAAGRELFVCPAQAVEELKSIAKESGATLFMALLAVFNVLLARYSGHDDILVGLPIVNRNRSALSGIVGVFINTVILRTDLSGNATFRELLRRVRKTTLDAQANQEVPLERVVRALGLKGDSSRSLVGVLFDLQKKFSPTPESGEFSIEPMDVGTGASKFDLVLAMEETGTELKGVLDYDSDKFEGSTARQIGRHFVTLVKSLVAAPDTPLSRVSILTSHELCEAELRGADTSDAPQPLALFETYAHEHPNALAIADGRHNLSYGELLSRANRLAGYLRLQGVDRADHIVLFLHGGTDFVTAQLAVMIAGAAFVPIDPLYPPPRVEFMIRDCGARFAIVNGQSPDSLPDTVELVRVERDAAMPDPFELPLASDKAYMIYTSGSTGKPKGVSVSHSALANLVGWHRRAFAITDGDRASQVASDAFDASIWEIWPYLASGASVYCAPREFIANAPEMRDWLVKNKITVTFAPTGLAEDLIEMRWPARAKLRYLLTGGDRLRKGPPDSLPFQLVNNYGPTENAVVATSGRVATGGNGGVPSIGRPIDNVWVRIVDPTLQPVPRGVAGELIVGGRSLANGYWNQPALTADGFVTLPGGERAYRTGDFCRFRLDGEIEFLGRLDTQVKVNGCRIELGEIEAALLAHQGIRDAAADIREFDAGGRGIVAYIVPNTTAGLVLEALRTFIAGRLPGHMIPSAFVVLPELARNSNGKIDRKKLPAPETRDEMRERLGYMPPRTPTEGRIAALWQEFLKVGPVDVRDDFFALGGDSLFATRLALTIRENFGVELPLSRMMSAPTVEALAAFVDDARSLARKLPKGLLTLRSGSNLQPPLFLTPPASGSPACYAAFAGALSGDRAVYGFEAPGLTQGTPAASIADEARRYVAAMTSVDPRGPYCSAGWSLGGPVAFEMACQLRDAGKEVAYLALIDACLPENGRLPGGVSMMRPFWWAVTYPFVERIPINYQAIRMLARWLGIALPESLSDIWRRGPSAGSRFALGLIGSGWRSLRVFLASARGFRRYQPRFFDGAVTMFRTAQAGTTERGSDNLLRNIREWCRDVRVHDAPGSHMTLMLDPKISSEFASSFLATINQIPTPGNER